MEEDTESKGKRIRKRGHLEDSGRAKKKKAVMRKRAWQKK
jgi:hypothetical protein